MSIDRVLTMPLSVVRSSYTAPDVDGSDYGHGTRSQAVVGTYAGLIQPRSARDRLSSVSEGAIVGTFRGFLHRDAIGLISTDDVIRKAATAPGSELAGDYTVLDVRNAAGQDHHLELELEHVTP